MEEILHQLRLVVHHIVYRVFCMPGGWEWDFFTINSIDDILMYIHLPLARNTFLNIDWCTTWPAIFQRANNLRLGDVGIQATDDERKILSASAVVNKGHLAPWVLTVHGWDGRMCRKNPKERAHLQPWNFSQIVSFREGRTKKQKSRRKTGINHLYPSGSKYLLRMVVESKYLAFRGWLYTPIIIWRSVIGSLWYL